MTQRPNDEPLGSAFDELKRHDAAAAPSFEATIRRARGGRVFRRTRLASLSLAATVAAAAAALLWMNRPEPPTLSGELAPTYATRLSPPLEPLLRRPLSPAGLRWDRPPIPERRLLGPWE
jgi:hypothetical protein